jgi:hypothetical protein
MEFGKLTRKEIAPMVGRSAIDLNGRLNETGCPPLEPCFKVGPTYLYDPFTVREWVPKFLQWEAEAPARAAARKEEVRRLRGQAIADEQARAKQQYDLLKQDEAAQAQFLADREAWVESIKQGQ